MISKAYIRAAEAVFTSINGNLTARLGNKWLPGPGEQFVKDIRNFLSSNALHLGDRPFVLKLVQRDDSSNDLLTPRIIADNRKTAQGIDVYSIGPLLRILDHKKLVIPIDSSPREIICSESADAPVFFYEQSRCTVVFGANCQIKEVNPSSGQIAGVRSKFSRPAAEYEEMIREHYEEWVKGGDGCDHWENPKKRILRQKLGRCAKTEEIFQESLLKWLSTHVSDGQVFPEPRKRNKDRADIMITTLNAGFYLVEIKWLGTNGKTPYDLDRIKKGLAQLGQYTTQSTLPEFATLVAYDGRLKSEFDKLTANGVFPEGIAKLEACEGISVPAAGSCYVFFLFSERASQLS